MYGRACSEPKLPLLGPFGLLQLFRSKGWGPPFTNFFLDDTYSHASKVMFRILQARLQQMANIRWIIKKAREFQKNIYFCLTDYAKAFDRVDHNKLKNS